MQNEEFGTDFSKAILTGLFLGICATLICLVYSIIYRGITGFDQYVILINWPATIFGCNLILFVFGVVYYFFHKMGRTGEAAYIVLFLLLTVLALWKDNQTPFTPGGLLASGFSGLLTGYIIILGICAFLGIPVLYHNKKFLKAVI
ncbi:MAG: hypothetical protein JST58_17865 [Bacteroidetes bacterium]|nr:hypothetical protein [Bacteroidota bacterium]